MYKKPFDSLSLIKERESMFKYIILELILLFLGLILTIMGIYSYDKLLMILGFSCILFFIILFFRFCIRF